MACSTAFPLAIKDNAKCGGYEYSYHARWITHPPLIDMMIPVRSDAYVRRRLCKRLDVIIVGKTNHCPESCLGSHTTVHQLFGDHSAPNPLHHGRRSQDLSHKIGLLVLLLLLCWLASWATSSECLSLEGTNDLQIGRVPQNSSVPPSVAGHVSQRTLIAQYMIVLPIRHSEPEG
jgi:hypothetical protein